MARQPRSDGAFHRLPQWAQLRITQLEDDVRRLRQASTMLLGGLPTDIVVVTPDLTRIGVPPRSTVIFSLQDPESDPFFQHRFNAEIVTVRDDATSDGVRRVLRLSSPSPYSIVPTSDAIVLDHLNDGNT